MPMAPRGKRRINEGVDPIAASMERADVKRGFYRVRYLRRDAENAESLGKLPTRVARRIGRRINPAA